MTRRLCSLDVEAAEKQLNKLLDARAAGKNAQKEQNLLEQVWRRTERAVRERERRENRQAWYEYHCTLANTYAAISDDHARAAQALLGEEIT